MVPTNPTTTSLLNLHQYLYNRFNQELNINHQLLLQTINLQESEVPGESSFHSLYLNCTRQTQFLDNDDALDLQCDVLDKLFRYAMDWAQSFMDSLFPSPSYKVKSTRCDDSLMLQGILDTPTNPITASWFHVILTDSSLIVTFVNYPQ